MESIQIIWLVLLVVFLVLEGATTALVSLWFCVGALAGLLVSLFMPQAFVVQFLVFAAVSLAALLLLRPFLQKILGSKRVATNADANIGKKAQVITEIQPAHFGRVNLEGQDWTAKSVHLLPVGSWCKVTAIEGVKLVVVPLATPPV